MKTSYKEFDSKRDSEIIKAGGFYCLGCLIGKPANTRSKNDLRYCQDCYDIIHSEQVRKEKMRDEKINNGEGSKNIKNKIGGKKVKKQEALELVNKLGVDTHEIVNKDGHFSVIGIEDVKPPEGDPPAETGTTEEVADSLSVQEVAAELGITPQQLRKHLRKDLGHLGKTEKKRYHFTPEQIIQIKESLKK